MDKSSHVFRCHKIVHEPAILMNGMWALSIGDESEDESAAESEMEGIQAQSTIEGITIEGVDNNTELHGVKENNIDAMSLFKGP